MAALGASLVIAGRGKAKNAKAMAELREAGSPAIDVVADVTQEESCRPLVAAAVKAFGRLDILVNNAGIGIINSCKNTRSPNGRPCSPPIYRAPVCARRRPVPRCYARVAGRSSISGR